GQDRPAGPAAPCRPCPPDHSGRRSAERLLRFRSGAAGCAGRLRLAKLRIGRDSLRTDPMTDSSVAASPAAPSRLETRTFRSSDSELRRMSDWFRRFAAASGIPEERTLDLELCLNEILTNINHYAYEEADPAHDIRVTLQRKDGRLEAVIEDDGRPFN